MALTIRPRRGRPRYPRRRFDPRFLARIVASGAPLGVLTLVGGFRQTSQFCALLHADAIPAAPRTLDRFYTLADALHFPREHVFEAGR